MISIFSYDLIASAAMLQFLHRVTGALCLSLLTIAIIVSEANAQATRTWVSAIGDDVNPCSRTAPGKTFAGAISKTATGGMINAIDPGGYGAVTIVKAITIDGTGTLASILAGATNGVVINAPNASVILRGLEINGSGTTLGIVGVKIVNAATVYIDRCTISDFQTGIKVEGGGQVIVKDSVIQGCTIAGIDANPAAPASLELHQTRVEGCTTGITLGSTARVTGTRVSVVGTEQGAVALQEGGTATFMECTFANNGTGLYSEGNMFVGSSLITNNLGAGLAAGKPGFIRSLKGNQLIGNSPDGKFSKAIPQR